MEKTFAASGISARLLAAPFDELLAAMLPRFSWSASTMQLQMQSCECLKQIIRKNART